ncbi:MAG: chemotaxis protein CheA [Bacillota bacterium]|nr:chemotaxis protein CheA [Bacillota bacterium]
MGVRGLQLPGLSEEESRLFLEEAEELLEALEEGLVGLAGGTPSPEQVQSLFRAAHTLKGNAGAAGLDGVAGRAHALESRLEPLRHGAAAPGPDEIDRMLVEVDAIRAELGLAAAAPAAETEGTAASGGAAVGLLGEASTGEAPDETEVEIRFARDCPFLSVRSYQVLQAVRDAGGRVVASEPDEAAIEAGQEFERLRLRFRGESEEVLREIRAVPDVVAVERVGGAAPVVAGPGAAAPAPGRQPARAPRPEAAPRAAVAGVASPEGPAETLRVEVGLLDQLMNLIGELVVDRNRLGEAARRLAAGGDDTSLDEVVEHLARLSEELQSTVTRARMQPLSSLFRRFPRMMRELARSTGKEFDFVMEGEATELDRSVATGIADPLVHLLRNAVDHGVEPPEERRRAGKPQRARIELAAWREENTIRIAVSDDGAGIDPAALRRKAVEKGFLTAEQARQVSDREAVELIFLPGFSTSGRVTEISGRGVGMDVVRRNVERIGGQVEVESKPGEGTRFVLQLPLTVAILRALLLEVDAIPVAIPLGAIDEVVEVRPERVERVGGEAVLRWREQVLPLGSLRVALEGGWRWEAEGPQPAVVVHHQGRRQVWAADRLLGEQEVVVKGLGRWLDEVRGLAGAAVLGDGSVALVLDVGGVMLAARMEG